MKINPQFPFLYLQTTGGGSKMLTIPSDHFWGFLQPKRPPKLPETFAKVENRRVAKLQNCSSSFFFFSEASSKLAQAMNCIFEREGPRHHIIFITIKLNSKAIYSPLHLSAIKNWMPFDCFLRMRNVCHMTFT